MQNRLFETILLVTMENRMKKYITAMIILAMTSTVVEAGTLYNVKVKNKNLAEGLNLKAVDVFGRNQNMGLRVCSCDNENDGICDQIILEGESIMLTCETDARPLDAVKWKRRIEVEFECGGDGTRYISFPRGKKWYDRDHLIKKDNRYVVKIKKSDC